MQLSAHKEVTVDYCPFASNLARLFLFAMPSLAMAAGFTQAIPSEARAVIRSEKNSTNNSATATGLRDPLSSKLQDGGIRSVLLGAQRLNGLFPLYRQGSHLYAALNADDLDADFMLLISVARGMGQRPLIGGRVWQFGNDWVCRFRRVEDRVHFVRRNVRYRAKEGTPEAKAVEVAYSDSVLFSLPIVETTPQGEVVVDLAKIFLSDLPGISQEMTNYEFATDRSVWSLVQNYPQNMELEVNATYSSEGLESIDSVPDARAMTVRLHYSFSKLPDTNYKPRLADDRIGYFLTAFKDYSKPGDEDRFVRYLNRWHLEKADPSAELSPPKKPIVFWLEKTIPAEYREPIRAGILEWNKAFEEVGFREAIVVRQQPDDATWQPGDVRYNTFRWITSGIGVAAGPSRVNPLTGQILDADITFDADFLRMWKRRYECSSREEIERLTGGPLDLNRYRQNQATRARNADHLYGSCACHIGHSFSHEMALSATIMARRRYAPEELEKMTMQAVKKVAMHEVGHTLGLRHNFKASTYHSVEQLQVLSLQEGGVSLGASVMDYLPANLAAPGKEQGLYYSSTIGPYDYWAIEYGYRSFPECCSPEDELPHLQSLASRSGQPGHAFATDEDTRGIDSDPHSGLFDYGDDLLEFAVSQADIVAQSWPDLVDRLTTDGESYQQARQAFGVLMITHGRAMFAASKYIGGVYQSRSHRGDPGSRAPLEVVSAEKQRDALDLLCHRMFSDDAFQLPPELYRGLAISHWKHWGDERPERADFPVHESILLWQDRILEKLLSPLTLARLYDSELQIPADQDAFTVAELLERLTLEIYAEVSHCEPKKYTNRQPAVSSMRRLLQHAFLQRLIRLIQEDSEAPSDCQAMAMLELTQLRRRIEDLLSSDIRLDSYTRAHLRATQASIARLLDTRYR